jgi:hypothetical protein
VALLPDESVPAGPGASPVTPAVPVVAPEVPVAPTHGVVVLSGPGMLIIGLTPRLPISVEPRGSVLPLRVDVALDSGDAVPDDEIVPDDVGAHVVDDVVVPESGIVGASAVDPPPSNVELVPAVPVPVGPGAAIPGNDEPVPMQFEPLPVAPIGAGLRPPGSSSVAPKGIPVGELGELEPRVPNGDVVPIAGMPGRLCARLGPQLTRIATATTANRRIETSCRGRTRRNVLGVA